MGGGLKIGIAGAGLLGRLLAWQLCQQGHHVSVFDPAADALPRFDGRGAAGFTAAGMLSPLAELDGASPQVAHLGLRSLLLWPRILATLPQAPFFAQKGSLLVAHPSDLGSARRVLSRLEQAPAEMPRPLPLDPAHLQQLEPALHGVLHAWLLPGEGQIDPLGTLTALYEQACHEGVAWHWGTVVEQVKPGCLTLQGQGSARYFDWVFDVRGLGARPPRLLPQASEVSDQPALRGVRGEIIWLHAPGHGLTRPIRLVHPRHRVYLVPRPQDTLVMGASEIESEDRSPVSLRTALELMSAAYSIMPALAEARILRMDANLRPAHPDNEPSLHIEPGRVCINGLFRHGWLLAPAIIDGALAKLPLHGFPPARK
jgi:glycine oxidase